MKHRREIDGLRAIAVLPVVLFHAHTPGFGGGYVGVDVFFVLSGYLITGLLLADLAEGRLSIMRFYERRARRILPALLAVALACLPAAWLLMPPAQLRDFAQSLVAVATFSSNILFWQESGYFDLAAAEKPLLHTWSLGVEEQFYVIFPLFLLGLWRFGRSWTVAGLALVALASLLLGEWGWRQAPSANFYLLPSRAWELLAGALCAFALHARPRVGADLPAALGLGMILLSVVLYDEATPFPSLYALLPVGGTCLVVLFAQQGTRVARLLSVRLFVGIGLISYSVYLWHQPLFAFARLQTAVPVTPALMAGLVLASLGLGWLSWRYIEQPFRGAAPRLLPTRAGVFAASALAGAALLGLGLAGHLAGGFPGRMAPGFEDRQAQLRDLHLARRDGIRAERCNFDQPQVPGAIEAFIARWDCLPDSVAGPAPRVLVFGDSHAADISNALNQNGFDHVQVTGIACSLLPAPIGAEADCAALRDLAAAHLRPQDIVILANRFQGAEASPARLEEALAAWAPLAGQVLLLAPRPEFDRLTTAFLMEGAEKLHGLPPQTGQIERFYRAVADLSLPDNSTVVDSWKLFCEGRERCDPVAGTEPLYVDPHHFSNRAAKRVGAELIRYLQAGTPADPVSPPG